MLVVPFLRDSFHSYLKSYIPHWSTVSNWSLYAVSSFDNSLQRFPMHRQLSWRFIRFWSTNSSLWVWTNQFWYSLLWGTNPSTNQYNHGGWWMNRFDWFHSVFNIFSSFRTMQSFEDGLPVRYLESFVFGINEIGIIIYDG